MRIILILAIALVTLSEPAGAQACNEKCKQQFDPETGNPIGWACLTTGTDKFCEALTTQCSVTQCGGSGGVKVYTSIFASDGRQLALLDECDVKGSAQRSLGALQLELQGKPEGGQLWKGVSKVRMEENRITIPSASP